MPVALVGLLWLRGGRWRTKQLVPEGWLLEATRTAPDIRRNCPQEQWCYGYGSWTNECGLVWPDLPRDSFAARGAGRQLIWVCPSLDLVVAESPWVAGDDEQKMLGMIASACR